MLEVTPQQDTNEIGKWSGSLAQSTDLASATAAVAMHARHGGSSSEQDSAELAMACLYMLGVRAYTNRAMLGVRAYTNRAMLGVRAYTNRAMLGVRAYTNRAMLGVRAYTNCKNTYRDRVHELCG